MVDIEELKRLAQPAEAEGVGHDTITCWNCKQNVTLEARGNEDGVCPHCMCELDLSDYLINANAALSAVTAESDQLRAEVERLRMQLAACGVVAMSNTPESAGWARDMHPDYMSASCQDVMRAVDREMAIRAEAEALRKDAERYQWLIKGTDDLKGRYWFPSLRSHDHQNPTEAIDAAMAAKEGG